MLSSEERAEYDTAITEAWLNTIRPGKAGAELRRILEDAVQAGRFWAREKLDEALERGLTEMAKSGKRKTVTTRRGAIPVLLGVKDNGVSVQLALDLLTPSQVKQAIDTHEGHRDAANRNLWALRRVLAVCDAHPGEPTVGAAMKAAGTTIDELLEVAA